MEVSPKMDFLCPAKFLNSTLPRPQNVAFLFLGNFLTRAFSLLYLSHHERKVSLMRFRLHGGLSFPSPLCFVCRSQTVYRA